MQKHCLYRHHTSASQFEIWHEQSIITLVTPDGVVQSQLDSQQPERPCAPYLPAFLLAPQLLPPRTQDGTVLILGLGVGAMLHPLRAARPRLSIVGVDNDPAVIDAAKRYFQLPPSSERFCVEQVDALTFIETSTKNFDLIFVDLFSGNNPRHPQLQHNFYRTCRAHLKPGGCLAINGICHDETMAETLLSSLQQLFPSNTIAIPIKRHMNLVCLASLNEDLPCQLAKLEAQHLITITDRSKRYGMIAEGPS